MPLFFDLIISFIFGSKEKKKICFWNLLTFCTQLILIFSSVRIFHLDRLEKVTWFHSFGGRWCRVLFWKGGCKIERLLAKSKKKQKKGNKNGYKNGLTFAPMLHLPFPPPTGISFLRRLGYPFLYRVYFLSLRHSYRGCCDSAKIYRKIIQKKYIGPSRPKRLRKLFHWDTVQQGQILFEVANIKGSPFYGVTLTYVDSAHLLIWPS